MNEVFDKIIIIVSFAVFVCFMAYLYRWIHSKLPFPTKKQMATPLPPEENPANTLHFCSKIIGIGLIFSGLYFNLTDGISFALFDFFIHASLACFFYVISIYIIDGIVLYNFEYKDEILKKQSFAYAIIYLGHTLAVAYLIKVIMVIADDSILQLLFLWALTMVFLGGGSRFFHVLSKISFNKFMSQMNLGVALSYLGFILGLTMIITTSLSRPLEGIESFAIEAFMSIILSLIILPIFTKGFTLIFRIDHTWTNEDETSERATVAHLGHGIYEGALFFTSFYLTGSITGHINFGPFYP